MTYCIFYTHPTTERKTEVDVTSDGVVYVNGNLHGLIPGGMTINGVTPLKVKVMAWKLALPKNDTKPSPQLREALEGYLVRAKAAEGKDHVPEPWSLCIAVPLQAKNEAAYKAIRDELTVLLREDFGAYRAVPFDQPGVVPFHSNPMRLAWVHNVLER